MPGLAKLLPAVQCTEEVKKYGSSRGKKSGTWQYLVYCFKCFKWKQILTLFLARGNFYLLLMIFANSLEPDQDRQDVGPDLDPNSLTLWWCSWKIFFKKLILKKVCRRTKAWKFASIKTSSSMYHNCNRQQLLWYLSWFPRKMIARHYLWIICIISITSSSVYISQQRVLVV